MLTVADAFATQEKPWLHDRLWYQVGGKVSSFFLLVAIGRAPEMYLVAFQQVTYDNKNLV